MPFQKSKLEQLIIIALFLSMQVAHSQFGAEINLVDINGSNGFVINGENAGDESGLSVSLAGDVNGDGIDDVIIGAFAADPANVISAGSSYVVFGVDSGIVPNPVNLSNLNGTNGFQINGFNTGDFSGKSVSAAGDFNGDGIDDILIGASKTDSGGNTNVGSSYVIFGNNFAPFPSSISLSSLNGSNGFVINGANASDESGISVSVAGDVNGDGIDDVLIGALRADPDNVSNAGSSYVVFGINSTTVSSSIDLSNLDGSNGFVINGFNVNQSSGFSVSAAGDVNGDGTDDVLIGAPATNSGGISHAGSSYVVFGIDANTIPSPINLSNLDGSNGFVINGINAEDFSGTSVSNAGDVNGDGIDDVLIGAPLADPNGNLSAGSSYVVFGVDSVTVPNPVNLSNLNGTNGFIINGANENDETGLSVSAAGDVNGDGLDDILIGAPGASSGNNSNAGISYLIYGVDSNTVPSPLNLSSFNSQIGFIINGANAGDYSGISVSAAGDVNGDGVDDILIGASEADPGLNFSAGSSYVVFGKEKVIFKDGFECRRCTY